MTPMTAPKLPEPPEVFVHGESHVNTQLNELCVDFYEYQKLRQVASTALEESKGLREEVERLKRYETAWHEWRSLQTGDATKMMDAAIRCTAAESRVEELRKDAAELIEMRRYIASLPFEMGGGDWVKCPCCQQLQRDAQPLRHMQWCIVGKAHAASQPT